MCNTPADPDTDTTSSALEKSSADHAPRSRLLLVKISAYLAAFAGGAAINDLSGTLGYPGLGGVIALLGVITAAIWLRRVNPRWRLSLYASRIYLFSAAVAAVIAAVTAGSVANILTAIAALLTIGALLVTKELERAGRLLVGAAAFASGAALIPLWIASFADSGLPAEMIGVTIGVALMAWGVSIAIDRLSLGGIAFIAAGVAWVIPGITIHDMPDTTFFAASGAVSIMLGLMLITGRDALYTTTAIAAGLAVIAAGVGNIGDLYGDNNMLGAGYIALGMALVAVGVTMMTGRGVLVKAAGIAAGLSLIAVGANFIADHHRFAAVGCIAYGVASTIGRRSLFGIASIATGIVVAAGGVGLSAGDPLLAAGFFAFGIAIAASGIGLIGPRAITAQVERVISWATETLPVDQDREDSPDQHIPVE